MAPTGYAASHIKGGTKHCLILLSHKKSDLKNAPHNPKDPWSERVSKFCHVMQRIIAMFQDEYSMVSEEMFGWGEHRKRNFRLSHCQVYGKNMEEAVAVSSKYQHPVFLGVAQCPHGGLTSIAAMAT